MRKKKHHFYKKSTFWIQLFVLLASLSLIFTVNYLFAKKTAEERANAEGQHRLSSITKEVEQSLFEAECYTQMMAEQVEQLISDHPQEYESVLTQFIYEKTDELTNGMLGSCIAAYVAHDNTLIMKDFIPDEHFKLSERSWFVGARKSNGNVYITDPYVDARTGNMCYTLSVMLPDKRTVVGLDFSMGEIQSFIEKMDSEGNGMCMIANEQGMIIGHSDPGVVGKNYTVLGEKADILNKVKMLYGSSFQFEIQKKTYNVFSDLTDYGWYLVVVDPYSLLSSKVGADIKMIFSFLGLMSVAFVTFFIFNFRNREIAQEALDAKNQFLDNMSYELKRPLNRIMNQSEMGKSDGINDYATEEICCASRELSDMLDNLISMSELQRKQDEQESVTKKKTKKTSRGYQFSMIGISLILVLTAVLTLVLNTKTQIDKGQLKMQAETMKYEEQVAEWIATNEETLEMLGASLVAREGFQYHYEDTVQFIDDIVKENDEISVAYVCNPEYEHMVIMNNGWVPDADFNVVGRDWYDSALLLEGKPYITSPYRDAQTGMYCVTFSKAIYDETGAYIGAVGIDYYMDKLIQILDQSYTDKGYAFLLDSDYSILNHPNPQWQMTAESSTNAAETIYRQALVSGEASDIKDYDGGFKTCLAREAKNTGFTVVVVSDWLDIYGGIIWTDILYLLVFVGSIILILTIMRNLTHWQEEVNRQLEISAEQAINADKAKSAFLANMSHEIRTPINAVLGMDEMILRDSNDAQIREYADNIHRAGNTLLSIINEILDLSKIESGKMEIIPVEYQMSAMISDLLNMISDRAEKKGLELKLDIDEQIPDKLYGDDVRVRQIIVNIMTNAVKYTREGSVTFSMKLLEKREQEADIQVSVKDTGIGIREEDIAKLFDSFQRLDEEKNRNIEGTGLGITIVNRLLSMMGSKLEVASKYGEGSVFSFVLTQRIVDPAPMGDFRERYRQSKQQTEEEKQILYAPSAKLLVVDDTKMNLIVVKSLLKRTGIVPDLVESGEAAIEKLTQSHYDLVLLDHMMPQMDGIETLHKIRQEHLADDTPFVALTANAISGAKQMYLDAGFHDYLSKPISGESLENMIIKYLPSELLEEKPKEE